MKKILFILISLLSAANLFAQSSFIIKGETNYIKDGKAILMRGSPDFFYPSNYKGDTVPVINHTFIFRGSLKYPTTFRLAYLSEGGKSGFSEYFFVDGGNQKIVFDSTTMIHNPYVFGKGILIEGSKANDEYFDKFLPLYVNVNKQTAAYFEEVARNYSISDKQAQKDSIIKAEVRRVKFRNSSDSILYDYACRYPKSPIISALLYDAAFRHNYSDYYYKAFEKISLFTPVPIKAGLQSFLNIQKLKGIGNVFPLYDFIQTNIDHKKHRPKYMLVDFWYSSCGPCIFFFNSLRETYNKYHDRGFDIVAISIDKKSALPDLDRVINKFQYTWDQVLDLGGAKTKEININRFPTTFLLDSGGKIIKDFIEPELLDDFLEKNL